MIPWHGISKILKVCEVKYAIKDPQHTFRSTDMFGELVSIYPFGYHLPEMSVRHGQQMLMGSTSVYLMQSPERRRRIVDYLHLVNQGDAPGAICIRRELAPLWEV